MEYYSRGYQVSFADILREYKASEPFKRQLDSGRYIYAENRLCLNHPDYIKVDKGGGVALTEYARAHENECCLAFVTKITLVNQLFEVETGERLIAFATQPKMSASPPSYQDDPPLTQAHIEKFAERLKSVNALAKKMPRDLSEMIKKLMKDNGIKEEDLAARSGLSEKTIQRLRNQKIVPTIETMVQLCIGLQLDPILSECLMQAAGVQFMDSDLHRAYKVLLDTYYPYSVEYCNSLLKDQKLPTLGKTKTSK